MWPYSTAISFSVTYVVVVTWSECQPFFCYNIVMMKKKVNMLYIWQTVKILKSILKFFKVFIVFLWMYLSTTSDIKAQNGLGDFWCLLYAQHVKTKKSPTTNRLVLWWLSKDLLLFQRWLVSIRNEVAFIQQGLLLTWLSAAFFLLSKLGSPHTKCSNNGEILQKAYVNGFFSLRKILHNSSIRKDF